MSGDGFGEPVGVVQQALRVQAQVRAQEARLDAAGVVDAQRPEPFDALRAKRAGAALADVVTAEAAMDDVDLHAVDQKDPVALADSGVFRELVAFSRNRPSQLAERYRNLLTSAEPPLTAGHELPPTPSAAGASLWDLAGPASGV
ncbi:hypothetical protein ACIBBB_04525 [Streptomyces sp. NPDC051217]|uniref:hypothetical protein n=1 Tax=Streptomyces sp. NPDC051217 TaxID=3365644 RepID=UPI00378A85F4